MSKDITEIIADLVSLLTFEFNAKSSTPDGLNFVLETCNTYWLRPCKSVIIKIGGIDYLYKIEALTIDESITLAPVGHTQDPGIGDIFTIPAPLFRHGTAKAINEELTQIKQKNKAPFIWLFEVIEENYIGDNKDPLERETPIRLYFFDEADPNNMLTENHYTEVIRPLRNLVFSFINKIVSNPGLFDHKTDNKLLYLPDWGEFNSVKGFEKKILDENWSGIELKKALKIFKKTNCKPC
jgi:hypothetical protein